MWDRIFVLLQLYNAGNNSDVLLLNSFRLALAKGLAVENIRRFMHSILLMQLTSLSTTIISINTLSATCTICHNLQWQ